MIDKNLIGLISKKLKIPREEFIEKDIILHAILSELAKDKDFSEKYAFKGGTCLIKCYLGYYRFSEDLDFTLIDGEEFIDKSAGAIRKIISEKVDYLAKLIEEIANKLNLDFKGDKGNKNYIEFGGGNKFATLKLWYNSSILNTKSFIKVQINFVEIVLYNISKIEVKSLISNKLYREIKFVYPEYFYLSEPIKVNAYDIKEILIEKIRAILTRRGIKERDIIDVFLIVKKNKIDLDNFKGKIINKIEFMLKYEKYSNNLKAKKEQLEKDFGLGKEANLLLISIPDGFEDFFKKFKVFLKNIASSVKILPLESKK